MTEFEPKLELINRGMRLTAGLEGPQTTCEYETDARSVYPERLQLIRKIFIELRELIEND